jgi:eukaryotic-like serine/threonine-protein kinase
MYLPLLYGVICGWRKLGFTTKCKADRCHLTPERWAQIEELFHRIAECDPDRRTGLLDKACSDDPALRREVEALLTCEKSAGDHLRAVVNVGVDAIGFPLIGETISHYRLLGGLGGGGMGLVYRAEDIKLGRRVALKFLPEDAANDPAALGRFEREARSASALEHTNICPIYEFGEHEGRPFLVMQLLEGQTLRELLATAGPGKPPLGIEKLFDLAIQIVDGLDAAHQKGIIHRDIKPANIFVTTQGQAKILDFGLAKLAHVAGDDPERDARADGGPERTPPEMVSLPTPDPFLSRTGVAMGTAGYMSPEQARGETLDARTDLFSFGLVLYEMATGQRAFQGDTGPEFHDAILEQVPVPAGKLNPSIPRKLEPIIDKALKKDRGARYQSAAELRTDLESLRREIQPKSRTFRRWGVAAGTFVLIGLGAALWFVVHQPQSQHGLPELKQRQLTDNSSQNGVGGGRISPDGRYLAYTDRAGMKIKLIETGQTQAIPQPFELKDKAVNWAVRSWFPDGTRFLANAVPQGVRPYEVSSHGTSIWLVSRLGAPAHKLRDNAVAYSISPDGSLISFGTNPGRSGFGDREIWLMGPAGDQARKLYDTDEDSTIDGLVWSPDGKMTVYSRANKAGFSLVTRDLNGGSPTTLFLPSGVQDYLWLPDGRLIYSLPEPETTGATCNFWEVQLYGRTSKPIEKPRRLTNWSDFCMNFAGATTDGRKVAFTKWKNHSTTYVATLDATGSYMSNPREFSSEGSYTTMDWTADSKAVILTSDRNGWIYKQFLSEETLSPLATPREGVRDPRVSPDGKWVLYFSQEGISEKPVTSVNPEPVMRVPIDGGPSQRVFTAKPNSLLSCAKSPSDLCAIAEPAEDRKQMIITAFDPLKGRGSELTKIDFGIDPSKDPLPFDLSPDGTRIASLRSLTGPIYILSLRGQAVQEVRVKGWNNLKFLIWTADGKGLFVASDNDDSRRAALLHVDLHGNANVLWENLLADFVAPSPDGRHLAFSGTTLDSNIWMIENF